MDPNTGDIFYRARNYDPYAQKFLSEDPIGLLGGDHNLYRYVGSMPLTYTDSLGLLRNPSEILDEALNNNNSQSGTNNRANAFQHCFASCVNTAENSRAVSELLGGGLEAVNLLIDGDPLKESVMDMWNNERGNTFGDVCPDRNRTSFNKDKSKNISNYCEKNCLGDKHPAFYE